MVCSLFQLNSLKKRICPSWRHTIGRHLATPMVLPLLFTLVASPPVQARPKQTRLKQAYPIAPSKAPPVLLGVVDEEKLAQSRSNFPMLLPKVLPQVIARRHLSLVVTRRGWKWGQSQMPHVDVTPDVLALLQRLPASPGALTGAQYGAVGRTLSALGSLKSVTALGEMARDDYQARLESAYVVYEASLPQVPQGALKAQMGTAMQGFLDARTTWDTCSARLDLMWKTLDAKDELQKLHTPEPLYYLIDLDTEKKKKAAQVEAFGPLFDAWAKTGEEVDAARRLLPSAADPTP